MNFKWNYQPSSEQERAEAEKLSEEIGISPTLCRLLQRRGVQTAAEAAEETAEEEVQSEDDIPVAAADSGEAKE